MKKRDIIYAVLNGGLGDDENRYDLGADPARLPVYLALLKFNAHSGKKYSATAIAELFRLNDVQVRKISARSAAAAAQTGYVVDELADQLEAALAAALRSTRF